MSLPEFDVLVELARNDPASLESLRQELTGKVIDNASSHQQQQRLKGLQFHIDMVRRKSSSPLGAAIKLSEMMCRSLADLHLAIMSPEELILEEPAPLSPRDNIIIFPGTKQN